MLPYTNREWEKLSILLNLLIPKLPAPKEEDLSKGILEAIRQTPILCIEVLRKHQRSGSVSSALSSQLKDQRHNLS